MKGIPCFFPCKIYKIASLATMEVVLAMLAHGLSDESTWRRLCCGPYGIHLILPAGEANFFYAYSALYELHLHGFHELLELFLAHAIDVAGVYARHAIRRQRPTDSLPTRGTLRWRESIKALILHNLSR